MKLKIVKKKASSLRKLSHECIEINEVKLLNELLVEVSRYEFIRQYNEQKKHLTEKEIHDLSKLGKVTFGERYNQNQADFEKSIQTMVQDYKDGLFKVFFNGEECLDLNENLEIQAENEVVFIRLVMMAGRLW